MASNSGDRLKSHACGFWPMGSLGGEERKLGEEGGGWEVGRGCLLGSVAGRTRGSGGRIRGRGCLQVVHPLVAAHWAIIYTNSSLR